MFNNIETDITLTCICARNVPLGSSSDWIFQLRAVFLVLFQYFRISLE